MLSDISQSQKNKYSAIPLTWGTRLVQLTGKAEGFIAGEPESEGLLFNRYKLSLL